MLILAPPGKKKRSKWFFFPLKILALSLFSDLECKINFYVFKTETLLLLKFSRLFIISSYAHTYLALSEWQGEDFPHKNGAGNTLKNFTFMIVPRVVYKVRAP